MKKISRGFYFDLISCGSCCCTFDLCCFIERRVVDQQCCPHRGELKRQKRLYGYAKRGIKKKLIINGGTYGENFFVRWTKRLMYVLCLDIRVVALPKLYTYEGTQEILNPYNSNCIKQSNRKTRENAR